MRFFPDDPVGVPVRWIRAPENAEFFAGDNAFLATVPWLRSKPEYQVPFGDDAIGELYGPYGYERGANTQGLTGQTRCGSDAVWRGGGIPGVTVPLVINADGTAPCCGRPAPVGLGGGAWGGSAVVRRPELVAGGVAWGGLSVEHAGGLEQSRGGVAWGGLCLEVFVVLTDRLSPLGNGVVEIDSPGTLPPGTDQAFSFVDQSGGGPYTVYLDGQPDGTLLWLSGDTTLAAVVTVSGNFGGTAKIGDATSIAVTAYSSVELFRVSATQWVVISEARRPGDGSVVPDSAGYLLVGDMASPGDLRYYGTNPSGVKGWYPLNAAGLVSQFAQTATVLRTNTASFVSLVGTGSGSMVIPASTLAVGSTFRLRAGGALGIQSASEFNANVLFGASAVSGGSGIAFTTSSSGTYWNLELIMTCRTAGASGLFQASGFFAIVDTSASPVADYTVPIASPATIPIDTTIANTVDLQVQFTVADVGNIINCVVLELERLR